MTDPIELDLFEETPLLQDATTTTVPVTNTATIPTKHVPIIKTTITHLIHTAIITTVIITALIVVNSIANFPPGSLYDSISFSDKFNYSIPSSFHPSQIVLWNDDDIKKNTLTTEFHSHTTHSDGALSPVQLVDWAIAYGFTALVVSDHNSITGAFAARNYATKYRQGRLLVVPAIEYSCCRIHMNLVGIEINASSTAHLHHLGLIPNTSFPSDTQIQNTIKATHELNGLVFVNHLPWSLSTEQNRQVPTLQNHPSIDQLIEWGVDGFECVSGALIDLPTLRRVEKEGMPYITATDVHWPDTAPAAWSVVEVNKDGFRGVYGRLINESNENELAHSRSHQEMDININSDTDTNINTDNNTLHLTRALLAALKSPNTTNFYHAPTGPHSLPVNRVYARPNPAAALFAPVRALDFSYLWSDNAGMYSFVDGFCHDRQFQIHTGRAAALVFWCFVVFGAVEVARYAFMWAGRAVGRLYMRWMMS